jgi:transglutaminase-like putative cysteine protease
VSVLRDVTAVVGGTELLALVVGGALALATLFALVLSPRVAAAITAALAVAGAAVYLEAAPLGWRLLADLGQVGLDTAALLTGISVLRMQAVGAWALGFAPAPVFLSWYLLVRRRYPLGVGVGGLALLAFVLTGNAGPEVTLLGVVGGAGAVGFGELEHRGLSLADVETLALVVAGMVLVTTTVSLVPASGGDTFLPGGPDPTVEGGVVNAGEEMEVVGSVSLSPEVRFVVDSDDAAYWRVGAYDRYTGQGWIRTGQPTAYDPESMPSGRANGERIVQRVEVRSEMSVVPAAWRPTALDGDAEDDARLSPLGGLQTAGSLSAGDEYTVVSQRPVATVSQLRAAPRNYPEEIEDRYTRLPDSTPDRLATFTDRITEGAESPYGQARRIQAWLQQNKDYSLDVSRPNGQVASSFVFEMESGYCTYFATAMATMLRTQGVPARVAVGYTTGQQVAADRYVVRGYNAHVWVEAYFAGLGWVKFDPTPAAPRRAAERNQLEQARENDVDNVDAAGSEAGTWTPTPTATPTPLPNGSTPSETPTVADPDPADFGPTSADTAVGVGAITPTGADAGDGSGGLPREVLVLGAVLLVGLAAGVRRSGAVPRLRRAAGAYWQRRSGDPDRDVVRAAERLEHLLERSYRDRRTGESRRAYLATVANLEGDDRIDRVGQLHERALYGGGLDRAAADEAVDLVDGLARERLPLLWRWRDR